MKKLESLRASASRKLLTAVLAAQMVAFNVSPAWAGGPLPVPVDSSDITTDGNTMKVGSTRVGGDIDWSSFDIDLGYTVRFLDSSGMTTVNKIGGSNPSQILGSLLANGKIYLINPNGILFGGNSKVNVGGLVASTMDYDSATRTFSNPGSGDITVSSGASINAGAFAYLVGRNVDVAGSVNSGDTLFAAYGGASDSTITLESSGGGTITLDLGEGWSAGTDGSVTITDTLSTGSSEAYDDGETSIEGVEASTVTLYASREISQLGDWTASAPAVSLTAQGDNGIVLGNEDNDFDGTVTATAAAGNVTLLDKNALTLGAVTAGGDVETKAAGLIDVTDAMKGDGAVKLDGGSVKIQSAVESTGGSVFILSQGTVESTAAGTLTAASDVQVGGEGTVIVNHNAETGEDSYAYMWQPSGATEVKLAGNVSAPDGAVWIGGNSIQLDGNVESGKTMWMEAENGSIAQGTGSSVTVGSEAVLHATGGDVLLGNDGNDFQGAVEASGKNVTLTDKNGIVLGNAWATNLTVTAKDGDITQKAGMAVTARDATALTASGSIVLTNAANDFATVTATAMSGNVSLTDKNSIILGNVKAADLTVTARDGDITQTSDKTVTATGTTALNASGDILLTDFENDFATVSATAGGDMSLYDANDLTVEDATAGGAVYVNTFDDLTVGNVEAKGIVLWADTNLTVTGTVHGNTTNSAVLVNAHDGLLTVEEGASVRNDTGWVTLSGRTGIVFDGQAEGSSVTFDVSSGTDGALTSGENAHVTAREDFVSVLTKGDMDLPAIDAGRLGGEVLGTGDITQSGAIHTTATNRSVDLTTYRGSITLTNADNSFSGNTRFVTGGDLDVHATGDLTVDLASAKNDMTLTADGGLTADYLTAGGAATLTAGNDIELDRAVSVTNALTATAGGSIIQGTNGVITVGDTTTLTATAGSITLTNAANDFGGVVTATATGGDVKLADKNDLELGAVTAGGGVDARAGGNLDVMGAVKGDQMVYLEATNGTARVDAPVESTSQNVRITALNVESTTNGTITAATDVNIGMRSATNATLSGKVTAGSNVVVNAWVNTLDADIEAGNNLDVVGTGAGDITITTNASLKAGNALKMSTGYDIGSGTQDGSIFVNGNAEAGDQLQFIAYGTGDVVQASTSTLKSGQRTVLEAHHGNITAESESNEFGPEGVATVAPEGKVSVAATNGIVFRTVNTTQLTAKAVSGDITQRSDKPFAVTGATTLEAPGNIVLTNADNEFGGVVTAAAGAAVSLTDANAIELGAVTATDLTVDAKGGTITQAADTAVTATGATTLTATDAITLANADNDFGGVVTATGANVTLKDANDLELGVVTATGGVDARAGGNLDVTGAVKGDQRVYLEATNGTARVDAPVESTSQNVRIVARDVESTTNGTITAATDVGIGMGSATNVTLTGKVTAGNDVLVNGWVNTLDADIEAGHDLNVVGTGAGDITVTTNANLKAGNFLGLTAGYDIGSGPQDGSIIVDGNAEAGDQLQFIAYGTGDVVQASTSTLKSGRATVMQAHHGNITAESEANEFGPEGVALYAPEGTVSVAATNGIVFRTVDTTQLTAKAVSGDITQRSDKPFAVTGATTLEAPGAITLTNADNEFGGPVTATGSSVTLVDGVDELTVAAVTATDGDATITATGGKFTVDGTVDAAQNAVLTAEAGAFELASGGSVTAGTNAVLTSATDMELAGAVAATNNVTATAGGAFTLKDTGTVTAQTGDAEITAASMNVSGTLQAVAGSVKGTATNGAITVAASTGKVLAGTDAILTAENGAIEIAGEVTAQTNVTAKASDAIAVTGTVTSENGVADLEAGNGATISGTVQAKRAADAPEESQAGLVKVTATGGAVDVSGKVLADTDAELTAETGAIDISGEVTAQTNVTAKAADALDVTGTGTVTAANGVAELEAGNGATISGTVQAARAADAPEESQAGLVKVTATGGKLTVADGATVDAATAAELNADADAAEIAGTVTSATNTLIHAAGDVTVADTGTVTATDAAGNLSLESGSDVTVISGATVQAGNNAFLKASQNATIGSAVTADNGSVWVAAEEGTAKVDAPLTAGTHVTVDGASAVLLNSGLTAGSDLAVVSSDGSVMLKNGIVLDAGEDLVLKAGQDLSLTTATIHGQNVGLEAAGALTDSNADLKADGTMVLIGSGIVKVKGSVDAAALGMVSEGDIVLDDLKATDFAATSTAGSVRVKTQNDLNLSGLGSAGTSVTADRADGETVSVDGGAAAGGLDGISAARDVVLEGQRVTGSRIQAGNEADIDVSALNVRQARSGGTMNLTAGSVDSGTIESTGGNVNAKVSGRLAADTVKAGRDNRLDVGGSATVQNLGAGGKLDADIGGSATLRKVNVGGNAEIKTGGDLTFDQMKASNAKINTKNLHAGKLTAGTAEIDASSVRDNGSLLQVSHLTINSRGDIGSSGKPINLETRSRIEKISGNNVYLVEQASGHNVIVGSIDARGHLSLTAPRIGLPDGLYGFVDGNGNGVNVRAGNGMELDISGFFGQPDNPMEANVNGPWTLRSGTLHGMSNGDPSTGTPLNMIYMVFGDSVYTETPVYAGDGPIPGLVIVNGRVVQGHPDLLRKIHSALAFTADTPELKSEQGVFGHPFFLHSNIALTDMAAMGLVDYLKFGLSHLPEMGELANANVADPEDPEETIGLLRLWGVQSLFNRPAVQRWEDQPSILPLNMDRIPGQAKDAEAKKQKTEKTDAGKAASASPAKETVPAKAAAPAKDKAPAKPEAKAPEKAPAKAPAKAPEKTQSKGKKQ